MLWNVYVIEDGECVKFNDAPFSSDMVAMALEHLASAQSVTLIPCSDQAKALEELDASLASMRPTADELRSSIRAASGNAWDDVMDVEAELAAMRGDDSAETEATS